MTRSERNKQKKYKKAKNNLTEELGRVPTTQEMSNVLHFKGRDMIRLEQYEKGETIKPYIEGETNGSHALADTEFDHYALRKTLAVVMDQLPHTLKAIVSLKYFEDMNFFEISKVVGLSEGRICQLHAEALEQLKEIIENQKIDILAA
jgi:RNA polymerase sigma factor for flagellar operon FliA